ncbi:MAG: hypothetical protein AAI978_00360 [Candidatus Hodgkinia cicadicola]
MVELADNIEPNTTFRYCILETLGTAGAHWLMSTWAHWQTKLKTE